MRRGTLHWGLQRRVRKCAVSRGFRTSRVPRLRVARWAAYRRWGRYSDTPLSKRARNSQRKAEQVAQAARDKAGNICGALKRNGEPCGRERGWGTDHPGTGRCKHHAGSTSAGRKAAASEELAKYAKPLGTTPASALQSAMDVFAGHLAYATMRMLGSEDDQAALFWMQVREHKAELLSQVAGRAASAGIAERQTVLAEAQTAMIAHALEAIFAELGLTKTQKAKIGPAVRRQFTVIQGELAA